MARPFVNRCKGTRRLILDIESLEARQLLAVNPIITEFMADNDDNIGLGEIERDFGKADPLGDGSSPDWIEIYNGGDQSIDLKNYYLTDDREDLTQWRFPSVKVEPDSYLLVFASGNGSNDNPFDDQGNLHTNFGLRSRGEYIALVAPDQKTVLSEFSTGNAVFPPQASDVSFGFSQTTSLISPQSEVSYLIPKDGALGMDWVSTSFDAHSHGFSAGLASLGYETRPDDRRNFEGQFETRLPVDTLAAYVRAEFDVADTSDFSKLLLQLQYDNGFIAYINGVEVARDNAPDNANWSSEATSTSRRDSSALAFAAFDLSNHTTAIQSGKNVLAIHLLNHSSDTSDMLLGVVFSADKPLADSNAGYLLTPTPGSHNVFVDSFSGPRIRDVTKNPGALHDDQALIVTAAVQKANADIDHVSLHYRIMFEDEVLVDMVDNGTQGDTLAGDGIYSATIPQSASHAGQMIRWRVTTADVNGNAMHWPLFADPENSDQYFGTMIQDPQVVSNLPVLHWFIDDANFQGAGTAASGRGAIFYGNQFYDNVGADAHGQSTRTFPKKSYDLDFNPGNRFEWRADERGVRDINLITNWADKAKFRHALAYDMYRDAKSPAFFAFPVRVQRNGVFFSVADLIEDADDRTLERLGLNPDGSLYKMYDSLLSRGAWEKKTRRWEDKSDLEALRAGTRLRDEEWRNYAFDNLDIPGFVNFLPLFDLQNNKGCCHKNYYLYRDTHITDEWQMFIWDPDLAFGHDFKGDSGYFDDAMDWDNPLFSSRGTNNSLLRKLYSSRDTPGFNEMYLRRLRTLMDVFLQPSDTPYQDRYLENRIDDYLNLIDPNDDPFDPTPNPPQWPEARFGVVQGTDDADLDYNTWGSWHHANGSRLHGDRGETMREHTQRIKDDYLNQRRDFLYGLPQLPPQQIGNPALKFGLIEAEPTSGNSAEEFIELQNPHQMAVDISGWRFTAGVDFTFPAGTVIPSGWTLLVTADKSHFRNRSNGPTGNQGRFIVGGWEGELTTGETLTLSGVNGDVVTTEVVPSTRIVGDVNRDGIFDSSDIVAVFIAGKYEDRFSRNTTFNEGDWNHDRKFDSSDLVLAFQSGNYTVAAEKNNISAAAIDSLFADDDDNRFRRTSINGNSSKFNEFDFSPAGDEVKIQLLKQQQDQQR